MLDTFWDLRRTVMFMQFTCFCYGSKMQAIRDGLPYDQDGESNECLRNYARTLRVSVLETKKENA